MVEVFRHEALLRARLELGLTQEELATSAGVDVRTYRRYESGEVNEGGFSVRQPARRRLLARLCSELGLGLDDLVSSGAAPAPAAGPSFRPEQASVLQKAPFFVGREALLDELWAWAAGAEGPGVIALVGVGGAGKTAVAERLLARLGGAPRAGGVFVWSFYDNERAEDFLERAAAYFSGGAAGARAGLAGLEGALRGGAPHLLVLDGLELAQADGQGGRAHGELSDPLLRRLLVGLARGLGATRALVTSRFVLSDLLPWEGEGARTVRLAPLSGAEAEKLLSAWGVKGDSEALRGVIEQAGGHALSLAVAGSYAGAFLGGDPRPLAPSELAEAAHDDPLARRLSRVLAAYAGAMPEAERDLLARLSVLASGADEAALLALAGSGPRLSGALAGLGAAELRRSLARLERLGLVFRAGEARWSSHPFVREHFRALLGSSSAELRATMAPPPEGTLLGAPRQGPGDPAQLDAFEGVLLRLLDAGQADEALRTYAQGLGGFNRLGLVLGEMSRGARVLRGFTAEHEASLAPAELLFLLYEQGLYAGALGDLEHACRRYQRHLALAFSVGEPGRIATGLRTMAYTLRLQGRLGDARACAQRSFEIAQVSGLPAHEARGLALLASIDHDRGDPAAAREGFARLGASGEAGLARRGLWEAEHLLALGEREAARSLTEANVAACDELRWAGHAAHGRVLLGLASLPEDPSLAGRLLDAARPWAMLSGEVEMLARIHDLSARVALARGSLFEAAREASAGEQLAVACGLGLFRARFLALSLAIAHERGDLHPDRARAAPGLVPADDAWGRADVLHEAGRGLLDLDPLQARSLLEEALSLRLRLGHPQRDLTRSLLTPP